MKKFIEKLSEIVGLAFEHCEYAKSYGKVTESNRMDLCQFQCNGALMAAKVYKKAPLEIARQVASFLEGKSLFEKIECVAPGFINLTVRDEILVESLREMQAEERLGCESIGMGQRIIIDYGGPNVAKPLHVGHLRTAIIGESIKRVGRFLGYEILGDVHLGDWGLPIGLIITELKRRKPHLIYFESLEQEVYPKEAPFTISELEEIYPAASRYAKEHPDYLEEAKETTYLFQSGHKGYVALWKHILTISIADLEKNYARLNVYFDLWKKESDSQPYIPEMIQTLKDKGLAYLSEGALVVDVKQETDNKEMPPCILVKSDGATLYGTTDLATIVERMVLYHPNEIIYIVDKRQEMHFEQVFRCAQKARFVTEETKLTFLGFGTMNGSDGKPFKTRDGGVMRLEQLIETVSEKVYEKVQTNQDLEEKEAKVISNKIGIAALKYGDLSNQIAKDYIFDVERFTAFEGNTGPYILYTIVRIQSILQKIGKGLTDISQEQIELQVPKNESERQMMLKLTQFSGMLENSFTDYMPHRICQYIYELSNIFNRFYHENKIIAEMDQRQQESWIQLITLTQKVLATGVELLGIEIPHKM